MDLAARLVNFHRSVGLSDVQNACNDLEDFIYSVNLRNQRRQDVSEILHHEWADRIVYSFSEAILSRLKTSEESCGDLKSEQGEQPQIYDEKNKHKPLFQINLDKIAKTSIYLYNHNPLLYI